MLFPGTVLAQTYKICHLIAEGGLAEIYLALNQKRENHEPRWVAIKRLKVSLRHNHELCQWFKEEALIISSLRHPYLVQGYKLIEENSELFIVMEYVRGRSLYDLRSVIENYPRALRRHLVIALGLMLGDALRHIHEAKDERGIARGLIHGDISAQNIMIGFDGQAKLVDFGNAMRVDSDRVFLSRLLCVNKRYMAPEQKQGLQLGPASDIYALGSVLQECLGLKGHFGQRDHRLENILRKATEADIRQRYQDGGAFFCDLQGLKSEWQLKDAAETVKNLTMGRQKRISRFLNKLLRLPLITACSLLAAIFVFSVLQIFKA